MTNFLALHFPHTWPQLKQHAMYVVVNMASSTNAHKQAVMQSGWPALLVAQLT